MEQISNFCKRMQDLRKENNISQEQLANKLGVSRTTISKWENGTSEPSFSDLKNIATILNTTQAYLLGEDTVRGENIIVVDTSILQNRPLITEKLVSKFDKVIIPSVVISELNYQKDHAKDSVKQRAWLAMSNIKLTQSNANNIIIDDKKYTGNNDDERIAASSIDYAKKCLNNKVYMFSNDIYFQFLVNGYSNIEAITPKEFDNKFADKTDFDIFKTQEFFSAVSSGNLDKLKNMDLSDVDINKIDESTGLTPLIKAVRNKNYDVVDYLLSLNDLDLEIRDNQKYKFTPLLHVCQLKDLKMMKKLIAAGANVNAFGKGVNLGNTPLMVCAWGNFIDGLTYLMECNVSYNQQDNNGYTALHKACIKNRFVIASLLIDKVDNTIVDHDEKVAYEYLNANNPESRKIIKLFKK